MSILFYWAQSDVLTGLLHWSRSVFTGCRLSAVQIYLFPYCWRQTWRLVTCLSFLSPSFSHTWTALKIIIHLLRSWARREMDHIRTSFKRRLIQHQNLSAISHKPKVICVSTLTMWYDHSHSILEHTAQVCVLRFQAWFSVYVNVRLLVLQLQAWRTHQKIRTDSRVVSSHLFLSPHHPPPLDFFSRVHLAGIPLSVHSQCLRRESLACS